MDGVNDQFYFNFSKLKITISILLVHTIVAIYMYIWRVLVKFKSRVTNDLKCLKSILIRKCVFVILIVGLTNYNC